MLWGPWESYRECALNYWSQLKAPSASVASSRNLTPCLQPSVFSPFIPQYQVMAFSFLQPSHCWLLSGCSLLRALPSAVQRCHLRAASASGPRDSQELPVQVSVGKETHSGPALCPAGSVCFAGRPYSAIAGVQGHAAGDSIGWTPKNLLKCEESKQSLGMVVHTAVWV